MPGQWEECGLFARLASAESQHLDQNREVNTKTMLVSASHNCESDSLQQHKYWAYCCHCFHPSVRSSTGDNVVWSLCTWQRKWWQACQTQWIGMASCCREGDLCVTKPTTVCTKSVPISSVNIYRYIPKKTGHERLQKPQNITQRCLQSK